MYSTPRKRRGGSNFGSPTKNASVKGLFQDGIWHCNCQPRLPASHFLVRKEGPNKGRWFYTCQESKETGCGFFLWDDDAAGREMRAVINNSRSEPEAGLKTAADAARDAVVTSVPDKRLVDGHIAASNKWMADLKKKEEDEFGDWPLSPDDELKVVDTVDKTALLPEKNPSTPQKATMQFDSMVTPGSKRKREEAWPTPQTSHRIDIFTSPRTNRLKGGMWDGNEKAGFMSPLTTPIPDRFHEAMKDAAKTGESSSDYDITQEVMALFKSQPLDDDTSAKLSQVLNQYALKSLGLARGRDMTRAALKAKDVKIAELQQRITALETERDLDKVIIKHFKSDMAQSINSRPSRGRGRGRGS